MCVGLKLCRLHFLVSIIRLLLLWCARKKNIIWTDIRLCHQLGRQCVWAHFVLRYPCCLGSLCVKIPMLRQCFKLFRQYSLNGKRECMFVPLPTTRPRCYSSHKDMQKCINQRGVHVKPKNQDEHQWIVAQGLLSALTIPGFI